MEANGTAEARRPPHVAMLVTPGMGHLIPLAELAKRLAARHGVTAVANLCKIINKITTDPTDPEAGFAAGVTATFITFASTASATQRAFLASLPPAIATLSLPPVDLSDLPPGATIETLMSEECVRLVPALTGVLSGLRETKWLVAYFADHFGADSFDAAVAAGVPRRYLFHPGNLHGLTFILQLPELNVSMPGEFRDLAEPVRLPGCVPIQGSDVMSAVQDKSDPCYRWMVHHAKRYRESEAILVNSFDGVEPDAARVLSHPEPGRPPVYNIGPLIRAGASDEPRAACLDWLDRQPPKSVIFVSFGSGGSLPTEHMRELALGLELSGQRFLWVVRSPSDEGTVNANYYDAESKKDPLAYLPEGFVERTKDVGFLVPSWAPQTKVLAHEATGGFLVHCGWNSVLESLVHGVPMVAWPLYAEQRQNAVMLTDGVGVAIREPATKRKEEIAVAVREVMVGHGKGAEVRAKVAALQKAAKEALLEGGAATTALDGVVHKWTCGWYC